MGTPRPRLERLGFLACETMSPTRPRFPMVVARPLGSAASPLAWLGLASVPSSMVGTESAAPEALLARPRREAGAAALDDGLAAGADLEAGFAEREGGAEPDGQYML